MFLNKVKKIVIFGGGTSGWLSAAYLRNQLHTPVEIVLVEDSDAGPIGVGEGTQPLTAEFLWRCGIPPHKWMSASDASFKYGVECVGWNDEPYFVDNDTAVNSVIAENFFFSDYFIDKPYSELADWHPAYQLAKQNVSLKYEDYLDVNTGMGPSGFGSVHFSAYQIINTIKELILNDITYIDTKITKITQNDNGIEYLINDDGEKITGDLFLDCTGFSSLLLEKEMGAKWQSFNDLGLLTDRAVMIQTPYTNPQEECHPYTKATTMSSGWCFTIPIFTRIGNGYVYSSKHISDEDAEAELRKHLGEYVAPARHLKMKCGAHTEIAMKNVVGVGLSAGFVEPLEATGITFTTALVHSLADLLNANTNVWAAQAKHLMNQGFGEMSAEIFTFVWAHYHFSTRSDTEFWKEIREQKIEDRPRFVKEILDAFLPHPKRFLHLTPSSMFCVTQWFSMLHAGGAYEGVESTLTDKQKEYAEYFCKSHTARVELAKDMFLNHYDYLKEWYGR